MNIDNAIARAQRLMLDENWNRQVEIVAAAQAGRKLQGGGNDLAALEAQAFGHSAPSVNTGYAPITEDVINRAQRGMRPGINDGKPIQMLQEQYAAPTPQNSRLPKAVLDSFSKTPPLSGDESYSEVPSSYFESFSAQQPQQYVPQQPQYSSPQPVHGPQPQYGAIDYNLIKRLVSEALNENRGLLTENASSSNIRGMRITDGSVIQFIDTKGNLYEGVLKLKKKAQK